MEQVALLPAVAENRSLYSGVFVVKFWGLDYTHIRKCLAPRDIQYAQLSTVMCFLLKPIGITNDPFHQESPISRNNYCGSPCDLFIHR